MSNIKFLNKEEIKEYCFNKIYFSLIEAESMLKREKIKYKKRVEQQDNKILIELVIL